MSKNKANDPKFVMALERGVMRSAFVSLFWSVIQFRKKSGEFTFKALAKAISANKSEVSRWFRGDPNWTINTIAVLSHALGVDLQIRAIDRESGTVFTPAGIEKPMRVVTFMDNANLVFRPNQTVMPLMLMDRDEMSDIGNGPSATKIERITGSGFTTPDAQPEEQEAA